MFVHNKQGQYLTTQWPAFAVGETIQNAGNLMC